MDPTFPVDLNLSTAGSGGYRHGSGDKGSGNSGGGGNTTTAVGDQIKKITGALFAVIVLLPAILYTGHGLFSPLLYEAEALMHPLHSEPASASSGGDLMAEHRTKGTAHHAVTGEFDAEDEGEAVLGASEAPVIEGTSRDGRGGEGAGVRLDVDWAEFLRKHDMVWAFKGTDGPEKFPRRYHEFPFIGNGVLGAGLAVEKQGGGGGVVIKLHIGRSDVWDRRKGSSKLSFGNDFQMDRPRLILGHFELKLPRMGGGAVERLDRGRMRLVLHDATVTASLEFASGAKVGVTAYAHATRDVLVITTTSVSGDADVEGSSGGGGGGAGDLKWSWQPSVSAAPKWLLGFAISGKPPPSKPNPKDPYKPNPPPKVSSSGGGDGDGGVTLSEQTLLAGGGYAVAFTDVKSDEGDPGRGRTMYVSVGPVEDVVGESSKKASRAVYDAVTEAKKKLSTMLKKEHTAWWHAFYARGAFVSVPRTWLEGFYYIQMYKLGSATRPGGNVVDLLGPWHFGPTAWADLHWDLNVQLTYLPMLPSGHEDLHTSLEKYIADPVTKRGFAANVPKQFAKDSWAAPASGSAADALSSCYWSFVSPSCQTVPGLHKGAIVGNLLWVAHNVWLQYRYTMDATTLKEVVYPTLHRAVAYYEHLARGGLGDGGGKGGKLGFRKRNKDLLGGGVGGGRVQLPVMASPEYKTNGPNPNYDLSLLKWGLQVLLDVNNANGGNDALDPPPKAESWKQLLASLPHYPRDGKTGYNVAQGVPMKAAHRHFSHLLMIYPLALESWEDKQARHLIEKSVDHWTGLCGGLGGACSGYSHTAASIMSSIMGRSDAAMGNITNLLLEREDGFFPASVRREVSAAAVAEGGSESESSAAGGNDYMKKKKKKGGMGPILGPNTMYGERCKKQFADPCPVIETPLHAAEALHSMLLASRAGVVDIFPAVPGSWPAASFHGMRAEGGLRVSAKWSEGRTRFVALERVTEAAPDTFDVRHRFGEGEAVTVTPAGVTVKHVREGVVRVSGVPSPEEGLGPVVLMAGDGGGGRGGGLTITPAPSDEEEHNYWGMH